MGWVAGRCWDDEIDRLLIASYCGSFLLKFPTNLAQVRSSKTRPYLDFFGYLMVPLGRGDGLAMGIVAPLPRGVYLVVP
jgi:hypothetical protein